MAALYSIWKRLSHVRLDGINYDIGIKERDDGRYTVSWVCLKCFEQGPPSPAAETLEQAVSFAQIGLRAHHGLIHADVRRSLALSETQQSVCAAANVSCNTEESRHTAYDCARSAFEQLCTAHARMHTCNGNQDQSKLDQTSLVAALHDLNSKSYEFDIALHAFSIELRKRAQELEAKVAASAVR
jgi:hypothetical protein